MLLHTCMYVCMYVPNLMLSNIVFCTVCSDTPSHAGWAETPRADREGVDATPTPHGGKRRSRWDETPASQRVGGSTPLLGSTPSMGTPAMGATPNFSAATPAGTMAMQLQTPSTAQLGSMTPEQMQAWRWERELDERNRPLSDEELDALFPQEGYKVRQDDRCSLKPCHLSLFPTDSQASAQLPAHPNSGPQADGHAHSHGYEWVSVSDGGQPGEGGGRYAACGRYHALHED